MSTFEDYLKQIGLDSYQSILIENGYDDPELISELTEEELVSLGVKRGHAKRAFLKAQDKNGTNNAASSSSTSTTSTSTPPPTPQNPPPSKKVVMGSKKGDDESDDEDKGAEIHHIPADVGGNKLQSKIVCEGFLQKKGAEGFFGSKVWSKRYFKLFEEGRIAYYKNQHDVSYINIIELRGALACEDFQGKPFAFKVSMKTSARVYYLLAQNAGDKAKWVAALQKLIVPPATPKKIDPNAIRPYLQHTQEPPQAASSRFDSPLSWDVIERPTHEGDILLHLHSSGALYAEETRKLVIDGNAIWVRNLPRKIDDRSVHFYSLSDPTAFIAEQTYHCDPITPEKMLEKLVGKTIEVSIPRDDHFSHPVTFKGELQYIAKQKSYALVNADDNTVHFLGSAEHVTYNLLDNKIADGVFRPSSLEWMVKSQEKDHLYKLSYNASDLFKWFASYSIILNPRESEMELRGFYTIKNKSGKTYDNVNLVLIREPSNEEPKKDDKKEDSSPLPIPVPKLGMFKFGKLPIPGLGGGSSKSEPEPDKRTYRYTYSERTTLRDNETKQLCFVSQKMPVKSVDYITYATPKYTKYASIDKNHGANVSTGQVDSALIFNWDKSFALPSGQVKLQRQNKDGFGSDIVNTFTLSHYNPGDIILVPLQTLGRVSATRKQTGYNLDIDQLYCVETFELRVNNGREEEVKVILEESLYRWENYEITYDSIPHTKHPSHPRKIQWHLTIPPLDGVTINYSVFYSGLCIPDSMMPKKEPVNNNKK